MMKNCAEEKILASTSVEKLFDLIAIEQKHGFTITTLWHETIKAPLFGKITIYFAKLARKSPQLTFMIGPVRNRNHLQEGVEIMAKAKLSLAAAEDVFILADIEQVKMFIDKVIDAAGNEIKDANGNPVGVENIVWTSADPAILSVVDIAPDSKSATIRTTGTLTLPEAVAQISVSADLIEGEGENIATAIRQFKIVTSAAVGFSTGIGAPEPRPL